MKLYYYNYHYILYIIILPKALWTSWGKDAFPLCRSFYLTVLLFTLQFFFLFTYPHTYLLIFSFIHRVLMTVWCNTGSSHEEDQTVGCQRSCRLCSFLPFHLFLCHRLPFAFPHPLLQTPWPHCHNDRNHHDCQTHSCSGLEASLLHPCQTS